MSGDPNVLFYGDHARVRRIRRRNGDLWFMVMRVSPVGRVESPSSLAYREDGHALADPGPTDRSIDGRALAILVAQTIEDVGGSWPRARERLRAQGIHY